MTNKQKKQIADLARERIQMKMLSQNMAATEIGISSALLSQMLNNKSKWGLIKDDKWRLLAAWSGYRISNWQIRETRNFSVIQDCCKDAQENHRMLAIPAYSGAGKTTGLKYYHDKHSSTYYVLGKVTMGRKDFLGELQKAMSMEISGSVYVRTNNIVERLRTRENPLLIIDDAGKLNDGCMRLIQVIYDELEFNIGLVLAGTHHFKKYIQAMASKDKMGFRELYRRIGFWQPLYEPTKNVVSTICKDFGIIDPYAQDYIFRQAKNYGSLRELITNAHRASNGSRVDVELLASLHVGTTQWED